MLLPTSPWILKHVHKLLDDEDPVGVLDGETDKRTLRVLASRAYDLELHAVFVDPPDDEGDGVPYPDAARLEIRSLE